MRQLVVSDASVCLKWFHEDGEDDVASARQILTTRDDGLIDVTILDLTVYEIGNALARGLHARGSTVATVLEALQDVVPVTTPTASELALAGYLADEHRLTFYDSAYAAVARERGGILVTFDRQLLRAGLGVQPADLPLV